jgi:hypothetical protein
MWRKITRATGSGVPSAASTWSFVRSALGAPCAVRAK